MAVKKKSIPKVLMNKISFLYVTAPNLKSAKKMSQILLKEKLIACANLLPGVNSLYEWKGEMTSNRETLMILKTPSSKVKKLRQRIEKIHPYEVPCLAEIKLFSLNQAYADWLSGK